MTAQTRATLYNYFLTNAKPTQAQFANLIDSAINPIDPASQTINSTITLAAGQFVLRGVTSGTGTIGVPAIAGSTTFNIPSTNGSNGQFLQTDGAGNTTWASSSTSNPLTLGTNGGTGGSVILNGATSGSCTIKVAAGAGSSINFQLPTSNGTNTQVLTTDGSGNTSWTTVAAAGGALTLLSTVNASGAANITFSAALITSTYNSYKIIFDSMFSSVAGTDLYMTLSVNDGGAYLASAYIWMGLHSTISSATANGSNSDAQLNLTLGVTSLFNAATGPIAGEINFAKPSASAPLSLWWKIAGTGAQSSADYLDGVGNGPGIIPINNIKLAASAGNLTGTAKLYGVG